MVIVEMTELLECKHSPKLFLELEKASDFACYCLRFYQV